MKSFDWQRRKFLETKSLNPVPRIFCPSTDIPDSTHVLAVRNELGVLEFLPKLLPFPDVAKQQMRPADLRDRVRMVGRCIQAQCLHWEGHCALGREIAKIDSHANTPLCALSDACRWKLENGDSICRICPQIMRPKCLEDLTGRETQNESI